MFRKYNNKANLELSNVILLNSFFVLEDKKIEKYNRLVLWE